MASKLKCYVSAIFIGCVAVALLAVAGPSLIAGCWHLAHKRNQPFEGYEIRVPNSFVLRHYGDGVELLRCKPVFSFSPYRCESIRIGRSDRHIDRRRLPDVAKREFNGVTSYDLEFGDLPVTCVEGALAGC